MKKKLTSEEMLAEIHAIRVQGEEDRKRADARHEAYLARMDEDRKRADARHEAYTARMDEDRKRSDARHAAYLARLDEDRKELKKLNKTLGEQMRSHGALVEGLVGESLGKLLATPATGEFRRLIENFRILTLEGTPDIDCVFLFEKAIIAVDIKSSYNKISYLKRFTEDLLPAFMSDPDGSRLIGKHPVFGAVAALKYSSNVLASAQKLKLFTVRLINDNASLENKEPFQAKDWSKSK